MYTAVLYQNWIRYLFRSIGYPIGPPSKLYGDNQATVKIVLAYRITPQDRPLYFLITALHEIHLRKIFEMVDTISNMQLADLNSKPHGGKSLQDIIDCDTGIRFYPSPGSLHYQQLFLGQSYDPTHINCELNKKSDIKKPKISGARNITTKSCAYRI